MSQLIAPADRNKAIERLFRTNLEALKKSAPRFVGDPGRLIRVAYNSIVYNPDLAECTQASLIGGVMEALKLGLLLGGPMQEAWLIPFKVKGTPTATFLVGYQGYRNIIDRGKAVLDLHPVAVYQGDEFSFLRTEEGPKLRHVPYYMREGQKKGNLTHVYAAARLRGGGRQVEVLTRADVDAHRARSRARDSGPWVTDYDAMALKTAIRVIAKYLPKSSDLLARALDLDDKADRGVEQDFDVDGLQIFDESDKAKPAGGGATPSALDKLKENIKGGGPTPPELKRDELTDEENAKLDREIAERERQG